ncbi:IMPACT family protein [Spiroplasma endosymbiont of Polydrusus pterygomalis]|uniref:IMPACT family protein n=1 Tax=Spiroplasma endosymbiont of Polydrusus pterygomalis TaxID=3139327 RepID=UPI003CCAA199
MQELKEKMPIVNEIIIKKSRFFCLLQKVTSENEALKFIKANQQTNATHNCYAYIIGKHQDIIRKSDDGEPTNAAGKPILDILLHHNLTNVVCLVIRYFGGIKLGAGGLIRTYANSVKTTLQKTELIPFLETKNIIIKFPITKIKLVDEYLTYHYQNLKINKNFTETISYQFKFPSEQINTFTLWTNYNKINLTISEHINN